ncbi:DUF1059 domain-containing protein [Flavobacteriaceae bacterium]|nr:DUF1059 domain-containing protein [Flavobacteriaceae bacterium]
MTCKQLGGACNLEFHANTFDEMVTQSQQHGKEMFKKADIPHLKAMKDMQNLMEKPLELAAWFQTKKETFNSLPNN